MHIGIHSVHTFLLEFVSLYLVEQSDAPALLIHIEKDTLARLVDLLHSGVELVAAVATVTAKNVARGARRMYTHEDWLVGVPSAFHKCRMFEAVAQLTEYSHLKLSVFGGHHHFGAALHSGFGFQTVGNEVFDGYNLHIVLLGDLHQLRQPCHRAVLIEDFYQRSRRIQTRQPRKIHSRLGMSRTPQYAPVLSVERIYVTRTSKGFRYRLCIRQRLDGGSPVVYRNTCGTAFYLIYRNGERRAKYRRIVSHLMREFEFVGA